jgi:hypothetical protein
MLSLDLPASLQVACLDPCFAAIFLVHVIRTLRQGYALLLISLFVTDPSAVCADAFPSRPLRPPGYLLELINDALSKVRLGCPISIAVGDG